MTEIAIDNATAALIASAISRKSCPASCCTKTTGTNTASVVSVDAALVGDLAESLGELAARVEPQDLTSWHGFIEGLKGGTAGATNQCGKRALFIASNTQVNRSGAEGLHVCGESDAIRASNLMWAYWITGHCQLVAGSDEGNSWFAAHAQPRNVHRGREAHVACGQPSTRS